MRCPTCGNYAACEPGGIRCVSGHMFLIKRILPRDHQLSGRDARNRIRQRDLDSNMIHPGRARELIFDRLERLEVLDKLSRRPAAVPAAEPAAVPVAEPASA